MRLDSSAARARSQNLSPRRATPSQPPPLLHPYPHLHPRAAIRKRNSGEGKSLKLKRRDLPLRHLTPTPPETACTSPKRHRFARQDRARYDTDPGNHRNLSAGPARAPHQSPLAERGPDPRPLREAGGGPHGRALATLGDNKVLNLHDRYKKFARGNYGRVSGACSTKALGRGEGTGRRGQGKRGLGAGEQHPWGRSSPRQRGGGEGAAPLSPNAAASISQCESSPQTRSGVPAPRGPRSLLGGTL